MNDTAPGHLAADCLAILAIYLLHQPLTVRVVVGLILAFGSAFDYLDHQGLDQVGTILLLLTLAFVNVMGFAAARGTQRPCSNRLSDAQHFQAWQRPRPEASRRTGLLTIIILI